MRKLAICLVLAIMTVFSLSAEVYSVKYQNEFGNTERAYYTVDEEDKDCDPKGSVVFAYKVQGAKFEVIDEDSDLEDLAIVNKLDRQGYKIAHDEYTFMGVKYFKCWLKVDNTWYIVRQ